MKWFVLFFRDYDLGEALKYRFHYFRAHNWQDAFDSIRKDRYNMTTWGLCPLEKDGTVFDGLQFIKCLDLPREFTPEKRDP